MSFSFTRQECESIYRVAWREGEVRGEARLSDQAWSVSRCVASEPDYLCIPLIPRPPLTYTRLEAALTYHIRLPATFSSHLFHGLFSLNWKGENMKFDIAFSGFSIFFCGWTLGFCSNASFSLPLRPFPHPLVLPSSPLVLPTTLRPSFQVLVRPFIHLPNFSTPSSFTFSS